MEVTTLIKLGLGIESEHGRDNSKLCENLALLLNT